MSDYAVVDDIIGGDDGGHASTESLFDRFAGVNYCLVWLQEFHSPAQTVDAPLLSWLLSCRALVEGDNSKSVLALLERNLEGALAPLQQQAGSFYEDGRAYVRAAVAQSWAAWLPFLIFAPDDRREAFWAKVRSFFPPTSPEEHALREVLFALLRPGEAGKLYSSENLPQAYDSQSECVVVRLGLLVQQLSEGSHNEELRQTFAAWRTLLRGVFHAVKHAERVKRGFAKEHPLFEDLVLVLLSVAEWRAQPELWRIHVFIHGYAEREPERLTPNQLVLASVLFGLQEGYQRLGSTVQNRDVRRHLSRTSLALALKAYGHANPEVQPVYPALQDMAGQPGEAALWLKHAKLTETKTSEFRSEKQAWCEGVNTNLTLAFSFAELPDVYTCEIPCSSSSRL